MAWERQEVKGTWDMGALLPGTCGKASAPRDRGQQSSWAIAVANLIQSIQWAYMSAKHCGGR